MTFHQTRRIMIPSAIGLIILLLFVSIVTDESTAMTSFNPAAIPSDDYSYYDLLYSGFINAGYDLDVHTSGGGVHHQFFTELVLESDLDGTAYGETRDIYMDTTDVNGHGICLITVVFEPMSLVYDGADPSYFMVFDSDFGLYLREERELHYKRPFINGQGLRAFEYNGQNLATLNKNQQYKIEVWVVRDGNNFVYHIYLDGAWLQSVTTDWTWLESNFKFGDAATGPLEPRGTARWTKFEVRGHSSCSYFDNFEDVNSFNWREVKITPNGGIAEWKAISSNGHQQLYIRSIGPPTALYKAKSYAFSPYFDYIDDLQYTISFDFQFEDFSDMFVVMDNNEIKLIYHDGKLKYIYSSNWANQQDICQLTPWARYYIEIVKEPGPPEQYSIHVTTGGIKNTYGPYTQFYRDDGQLYVEFGDRSSIAGIPQVIHGAYWDNIRVVGCWVMQQASQLNLDFQSDDHILTFYEDFEDYEGWKPIDIEEFGWYTQNGIAGGDPHDEGDPDTLWQIGDGSYVGAHTGQDIAATDLDNDYPNNAFEYLVLPSFDIEFIDTATLSFHYYIDTEDGHDGFKIETRTCQVFQVQGRDTEFWNGWDNTLDDMILNDLFSWYAYDEEVVAFNNEPAWSGSYSYWHEIYIPLDSIVNDPTDFEKMQIRFVFRSDNTNTGWGVGIDDIKIHAMQSDPTVNDFDNDLLSNWVEQYFLKSSPFSKDTDGDELEDGTEIMDLFLSNEKTNIFAYRPADPCKRDIFIEVDSMEKSNGYEPILTSGMKTQFNKVVNSFNNHNIDLHIYYDEMEINRNSHLTLDEWENIALLHHNNAGRSYHCLIAAEYDDDGWWPDGTLGHAYRCYSVYIIYVEQFSGGAGRDENIAETFQHELGHCLGMHDILANDYWGVVYWDDWSPEEPDHTSMVKHDPSTDPPYEFDYLGEESNTRYDVEEKDWNPLNDENFKTDLRLGGWENVFNRHEDIWISGLYWKALDYPNPW